MYTTQEGTDVTLRISEGKTKVFDTEIQAETFARASRSYHYPLYKNYKGGRPKQVGFAVPK